MLKNKAFLIHNCLLRCMKSLLVGPLFKWGRSHIVAWMLIVYSSSLTVSNETIVNRRRRCRIVCGRFGHYWLQHNWSKLFIWIDTVWYVEYFLLFFFAIKSTTFHVCLIGRRRSWLISRQRVRRSEMILKRTWTMTCVSCYLWHGFKSTCLLRGWWVRPIVLVVDCIVCLMRYVYGRSRWQRTVQRTTQCLLIVRCSVVATRISHVLTTTTQIVVCCSICCRAGTTKIFSFVHIFAQCRIGCVWHFDKWWSLLRANWRRVYALIEYFTKRRHCVLFMVTCGARVFVISSIRREKKKRKMQASITQITIKNE